MLNQKLFSKLFMQLVSQSKKNKILEVKEWQVVDNKVDLRCYGKYRSHNSHSLCFICKGGELAIPKLHCCPFLRVLRRSKGFSTWRPGEFGRRTKLHIEGNTAEGENTDRPGYSVFCPLSSCVSVFVGVCSSSISASLCYFSSHSDSILRVFELSSKLFEFSKRKEKSGNQNYPKSLVFIFLT